MLKFALLVVLALLAVLTASNASTPRLGPGPAPGPHCPQQCM